MRHAEVESVNAVSGTGRWLGSTKVKEGSNEIPAARAQLAKLDIVDKIVLADAAHTQEAMAQQILYEQGGEYLLTVKKNQPGLFETLSTLFTEQRFSPSAHPAHPRHDSGEQPGTTRNPGDRLPGCPPTAGGLSGSSDHRPAAAPGPAQG
jgi:predicted transposase YbfD/YdcC